jgi:hypothetical protein
MRGNLKVPTSHIKYHAGISTLQLWIHPLAARTASVFANGAISDRNLNKTTPQFNCQKARKNSFHHKSMELIQFHTAVVCDDAVCYCQRTWTSTFTVKFQRSISTRHVCDCGAVNGDTDAVVAMEYHQVACRRSDWSIPQ